MGRAKPTPEKVPVVQQNGVALGLEVAGRALGFEAGYKISKPLQCPGCTLQTELVILTIERCLESAIETCGYHLGPLRMVYLGKIHLNWLKHDESK